MILAGEGTIEAEESAGLPATSAAAVAPRRAAPAAPASPAEDPDGVKFQIGTTVEEAEKGLILRTLEHTRNNKTRAAEILGISLKTLHNKLKEYGYERAGNRGVGSLDPGNAPAAAISSDASTRPGARCKIPPERAELRPWRRAVAQAAFERWLSRRTAEDNRVEHEFVVFGAAMRIAEAERLPLSGKLVVVCFTFLHDTYPIRRITETAIREAAANDPQLRGRAAEKKARQRIEHMQGGARNADLLLRELGIRPSRRAGRDG